MSHVLRVRERLSVVGRLVSLIAIVTFGLAACLPVTPAPTAVGPRLLQRPTAMSSLKPSAGPTIKRIAGPIPFPIEQNVGQADPTLQYLLRSGDMQVGFAAGGPRLLLTDTAPDADPGCIRTRRQPGMAPDAEICPTVSYLLGLDLVGADAAAPTGVIAADTTVSRFVGDEPEWKTGIPSFHQVAYRDAWPGVDVLYERAPGVSGLKSAYVVEPHSDPSVIRLAWRGVQSATVDEAGDLLFTTPVGTLRERAPVAWQDRPDGGREAVSAQFVLYTDGRDGLPVEVGFMLGTINAALPLVIDPPLAYSSYLGGSGLELTEGVAVDSDGNAFVVGPTSSANFPTTVGAFQTSSGGTFDAFVAKLNPTGTGLVYVSYLGGSSSDSASKVVVDDNGNAHISGSTLSTNFPTTPGAIQTSPGGGFDAFVAELNPSGSALVYSTYLGGTGNDDAGDLALDGSNNVYVSGSTAAANFPTTAGAFQMTYGGGPFDGFVAKINPSGTALMYSTYLGGSGDDELWSIVVGGSDNAYVAGGSGSANFPTTPSAFQTSYGGGTYDAVVTQLNGAGSALVFSTYVGGSLEEMARGLARDGSGNVYLVGYTDSTNFPTTSGAFQTASGGNRDAFAVKLNPTGTAFIYSTFLGGSGAEQAFEVALDANQNAYIVGYTASTEFPTTGDAAQASYAGGRDGFLAQLNTLGMSLIYSTFLGSAGEDHMRGVIVGRNGLVYVVGLAASGFSTTPGAFQTTYGGNPVDAVVLQFGDPTATPTPTVFVPPPPEDDVDKPKRQTEQERQQQQHTNTANMDQYHTEGPRLGS